MPDLEKASWIWSPDQSTNTRCYFRKIVDLPGGVKTAKISLTAVYSYSLHVNGKKIGWDTPNSRAPDVGIQVRTYDLSSALQPGRNVIAVDVFKHGSYAGLLGAANLRLDSGEELTIVTDSSWLCSDQEQPGWTTVEFMAEGWKPAVTVEKPQEWLNNYGKVAQEEILSHEFTKPPIKMISGDLSVYYTRWRAGTLPADVGQERPSEIFLDDPYKFASLKKIGYEHIFDYIPWFVVEAEKDQFDWSDTERNIRGIKEAGFKYSACMWIQFMPDWYVRENQSSMMRCLQHNEVTGTPSLWAPQTLEAYSRFYEKLSEKFPTEIDTISVGLIGCYSEGGYPLGAAQWVVPTGHKHTDFWVGDDYARKDFADHLEKKYKTIAALNEAWGTAYENFAQAEYPAYEARQGKKPRAYLDFLHWYTQSNIDFAGKVIDVINRYFPNATMNLLSGGTAGLPQATGVDGTGFMKLAGETAEKYGRDKIVVTVADRGGNYFWDKFYTTAAQFYGIDFVSCPAGPGLSDATQVRRIFSDASGGIDGFHDYPENIWPGVNVWKEYSSYLTGDKPVVETAVFLPTSESYLQEYPIATRELGLAPTMEGTQWMRDISDYDVVDERLVQEGALDKYRFLVVFQGNTVEKETMEKIAAWVKNGGVLLARSFGPMATVEGDTTVYRELFPASTASTNPLGFRFTAGPNSVINPGEKADAVFLTGTWHGMEQFSAGSRSGRWTERNSGLLLPVDPQKNYQLKVSAMIPPDKKGKVLVNGQEIGTLMHTTEIVTEFSMPASVLKGQPLAEIVFDVPPSGPAQALAGEGQLAIDGRPLGIFVLGVEWIEEGAGTNEPATPQWQASVPWEELRRDWTRKSGEGLVVLCPEDNAFQFCWLVNQILHQPEKLDPSLKGAFAIDAEWDGVQATLFSDRIVYYNPTDQPIQKPVRLRAEDFQNHPEIANPGNYDHTISLPPHSMCALPLKKGS